MKKFLLLGLIISNSIMINAGENSANRLNNQIKNCLNNQIKAIDTSTYAFMIASVGSAVAKHNDISKKCAEAACGLLALKVTLSFIKIYGEAIEAGFETGIKNFEQRYRQTTRPIDRTTNHN